MAIGFPPFYKDRKKLSLSAAETREIAIAVLVEMKCEEVGLHPFALDYKTLGSMLATGERIYVNITEEEIIIRSECIFFTRIFDFGVNKKNVQDFWKIYDRLTV